MTSIDYKWEMDCVTPPPSHSQQEVPAGPNKSKSQRFLLRYEQQLFSFIFAKITIFGLIHCF